MYFSTGVVLSSGEQWSQERRFILEVFKDFGVGRSKFEDQVENESSYLIKKIASFSGKQFDPNHTLVNAVSNVICSIVFGKRYEYTDTKFENFLEIGTRMVKLTQRTLLFLFVPVFAYLPFAKRHLNEINSCNYQLLDFVDEIIKIHRKDLNPYSKRDLIDSYLNELEHNKHGKSGKLSICSEFTLQATIRQLFVAGTDTTALTLRWAMLYMSRHPDIQDRVHKEIDAIVGRNRLPKLADKPNLQYTQAVLLEIQRLATISRLGVPHACSKTTTVSGMTIPEGSIVISNLWAVHRDPDLWPEPYKLKPERFLNDDGEIMNREQLIPFSTGKLTKIVKHLCKPFRAWNERILIFHERTQNYTTFQSCILHH